MTELHWNPSKEIQKPATNREHVSDGLRMKFLKDPDGKFYEQKRKETLGNDRRVLEKILNCDISQDGWTSFAGEHSDYDPLGCREVFSADFR